MKASNAYFDDMRLSYLYDRIEGRLNYNGNRYFDIASFRFANWYAGYVTLHELGDGLNDYLLRQALVEVSPIEHSTITLDPTSGTSTFPWRDPKLFIQYRNRENKNWANAPELPAVPFPVDAGLYDLVELNSRLLPQNTVFWSDLNRPVQRVWTRESLVLNTPLNSKFRRFEATFITTSLSYLKGFKFKYAKFMRKTFG
jgi:hypothetical protein